jgi:hypothetical protein
MCQSSRGSLADYSEKHADLRVLADIENWKSSNAYKLLIYSSTNSKSHQRRLFYCSKLRFKKSLIAWKIDILNKKQ